ncbi:transglutaminase domain-containing protein [bacterium]|nr:transglutaminase domain-containing protein [bacterium]
MRLGIFSAVLLVFVANAIAGDLAWFTRQKAVAHYKGPEDSLKRKAVEFLFDNMEGHSYVTYDLVDSTGMVIAFDVLSFETYDALTSIFSEMEKQHGVLDFKKREEMFDSFAITPDFVISHVDAAFAAWERPWARHLSFEQFCEFILPYRGSNEPLELWREFFDTRYDSAFAKMQNPSDPVEAARIVNQDLISWFHFDPRFYYHPTDQGLADMQATKLGRCEDMTNLTIYAMRANGLAVTSDYTPYWANSGNNHAWNAIVTANGEVVPFMGAEANPGEYQLANKLAKVYRKTFSLHRENLAFQVDDPDKLPRYLASKSYVDVTKDYTASRALALKVDAPDSVQFAYLCVFNSGEWKPIEWGRIVNDSATFRDMGVDVAYLPGLYVDEKILPAGDAVLLSKEGIVTPLLADSLERITLRLNSTTRVKQDFSTDGIAKTNLEAGTSYELFYWEGGGKKIGEQVAVDAPLEFAAAPGGGLYWLTAKDSDKEERIFTYENGTQVWW